MTHGKESRSQILQEKQTSCQTGNFTTAETTCLSTTRRRQPSTLTREEPWLITKERRLTLCLLLTRKQSRIFLKTTFLRLDFIVILTLLKTFSTQTISSLTLKHGLILDNGSIILTQQLILIPQLAVPKLNRFLTSTSNGSPFATAETPETPP